MTSWFAVVGVVLLAFLTFAIGLSVGRRRARRDEEMAPLPGLGDGQSTIRSYVIPKRFGKPAAREIPLAEEQLREKRYGDAAVEIIAGDGEGANFPVLKGRTRIGREDDNHIVLDDERVSSHHALITVREEVYWLEDLGSTNGTFVGEDVRVMEPHALGDGESFRIGGMTLRFHGQ
jgi:hypothetical protein